MKKRSAANSASTPQPELTIFVDKNLGLYEVPNALRACGLTVECKTDHFEQDTPDTVWVPEVGKRGWIIISADKNLRHNYLEVIALLKSGTASFLLSSGNFTGKEMADAFVAALPEMTRMLSKFPKPFVASVSKLGKVRVIYTFDGLIKKVSG